MGSFALLDTLGALVDRRKRDRRLHMAEHWPVTTAKTLKPTVAHKDRCAPGEGLADSQVEVPFYFTLDTGGYFGGQLRSEPCPESQARRLAAGIPEDTRVAVRYNPCNPDEVAVLAEDNRDRLPFAVWSN